MIFELIKKFRIINIYNDGNRAISYPFAYIDI